MRKAVKHHVHSSSYEERIEHHEMDEDPLARLNRSRTKRLEEFLAIEAEDNNSFFNHESLQTNDHRFYVQQ